MIELERCKRYPDCDCFRDWVEPALKRVSESEAEFFRLIMKEVEDFCSYLGNREIIKFEALKSFLDEQIKVIPTKLWPLFSSSAFQLVKDYAFLLEKKSDVKRVELFLSKLTTGANNSYLNNDPLTFIEPDIIGSFIKAEEKALGEAGKFETDIRCAAFCELLYSKKYIINTKTRKVTMNNFSKSKYGIDILNALAATKEKKAARENHKTKKVKGLIPLKTCF